MHVKRFHYAWAICLCCTAVLFCTAGLAHSAFPIYLPYFVNNMGMTNTESSIIVTAKDISALVSVLFVKQFYEKLNMRRGFCIALGTAGIAFLLYSRAGNVISCSIAAVFAGMAYGLGGIIPASIIISRWFSSHQGLALGICAAGTGLAPMLSAPVITYLLTKMPIQSVFMVEGLFIGGMTVIGLLVLRNAPEDMGLAAYISNAKTATVQENGRPQSRYLLRHIIVLYLALLIMGAFSNSAYAYLPMLLSTNGIDKVTVSLIISLAGLCMIIGKCSYGRIADIFGLIKANFLFCSVLVAGMVLCCLWIEYVQAAVIASVLLSFGFALSTVGISLIAKSMSDKQNHAKLVRNVQLCFMGGGFLFTPFPGTIADAVGSYGPAYIVMTVLCVVSFLLLFWAMLASAKGRA